ncbi:glutamate-5-semialdehyde dehydrogenase [Gelria sp. Kuro-4]|uniref:glutamate-5-semialdehyde dehydrogenase n=1 Tax=Gelria sp. Kuro-4 TaxID=2796927 RepID=UPI001BEF2734|nr:gamma-glutamyl phosphate reductase [Gelria sp. Kuro-4]
MNWVEEVKRKGRAAKAASRVLATLPTAVKDRALAAMAGALLERQEEILTANRLDVEEGRARGLSAALLDRLTLDPARIRGMAEGLKVLRALPDPIGEVVAMWKRPNGLRIGQVRVPLGVIGIIYEARPNVTVDAAGLALKAGNAVILKGGSEAINSNKAIVKALQEAVSAAGLPQGCIQLIEDTTRAAAAALMKLNEYLDVLIPRGGAGLIRAVVENATVPVIETGVGNCHVYVDASADREMARRIVLNAKCSRPGVCNAIENLLVDEAIADAFLPVIVRELTAAGVEVRGCPRTRSLCPEVKPATEEDWGTEYLDYIIAVKVVAGLDEAIRHINTYGTHHSEAIVTENYSHAQRFLEEVDAAAVYVNASTRFTDGFEFGFGAEMGISTQKLHARGPMGLKELTTIKYIIYGNGQIRE